MLSLCTARSCFACWRALGEVLTTPHYTTRPYTTPHQTTLHYTTLNENFGRRRAQMVAIQSTWIILASHATWPLMSFGCIIILWHKWILYTLLTCWVIAKIYFCNSVICVLKLCLFPNILLHFWIRHHLTLLHGLCTIMMREVPKGCCLQKYVPHCREV